MKQSTAIFLTKTDETEELLFTTDELLPNIFIGMCLWLEGNRYRVSDITTIAEKGSIYQHIEVESRHITAEK